MTTKTLGIDLGTNSLGWAIINNFEDHKELVKAGSLIFQEGVARDKGNEKPAVEARTNARATRRHYFRRRLRKIDVLKILRDNNLCPFVSDEALALWRSKKEYPLDEEFLNWQKTDGNNNPYYARHKALSEKLDLDNPRERYLLGRAFYHLSQRRGFLSNRRADTKEADGAVKHGIADLSQEMANAGCDYLGEFFFRLYQTGGRIRSRYTDRLEHIEKEFLAICDRQQLPAEVKNALHKAIFFQRPLKSQKGTVAKCNFEPSKSRCPLYHPSFEEFRMQQFINNIRIRRPDEEDFLPLSEKERLSIQPLFFRKSKESFDFEDIAKKIAGKGNYSFRDDKVTTAYKFNYRMTTSVAGNPVTTGLMAIFGSDWEDCICSCYTAARGKSRREIINDIWHSLYFFESTERLEQWAKIHLQLSDEQAASFAKIKVPQGYASLSLKAIHKILPYLRKGIRYDNAVFLANIDAVLPEHITSDPEAKSTIESLVVETLVNFCPNPIASTKQQAIRQLLEDIPGIDFNRIDCLYHPSKVDTYPVSQLNANGRLLLGSPRTASIRNPMAMRAMFKLRHLVNRLLLDGDIDRATRINIEFSRSLNDANKRKAIEQLNREQEKKRKEYADKLSEFYRQEGLDLIPSETDILKYELWEEQNHICLYTGKQIGLADFIGNNPVFDIEHTVPRAVGGDNSKANKTLCCSVFNRQTKRAKLPSLLTEGTYAVILERIESLGWNKKIEDLSNQIAKIRTSGASTKDIKDRLIQKRHYLKLKLEYWQEKVRRFKMTEVPDGFSNRQGVDIGIIGKYAKEYLQSVFNSEERQIFTVKGLTTAEFRKMWGLQDEYAKKERVNHCHHAIDAIVIACIGRREYQLWAEYVRNIDDSRLNGTPKPQFEKPWSSFTEDIKAFTQNMLIVHQTPDNTLKQSKKKLRIRGVIQKGADNQILFQQGDTARAILHKQTFYGAIKRGVGIKYVLRKPLDSLEEKDIDKIVDATVKQKIQDAIKERGFKHLNDAPVWMNAQKGIQIKKVRVYTPEVTSPIHLKQHRNLSEKSYKQSYHVANDSNFGMAIYEGTDSKGRSKRSFLISNNLEAVKHHKSGEEIFPLSDSDGYPLKWILKTGQMVLFYENTPKEVLKAPAADLTKRLYEIIGLSTLPTGNGYGSISLRFHQEARESSKLKFKSGKWNINEDVRPLVKMLHTQFNALVEGQDFIISESGNIEFLHALC